MSSFSTEEKLDLLIKKIAFGKAKTETSENTDPFGEATASPLLLRADKLWRESGNIPSSPPDADTSQVELYTGADTVECTAVSAAQNTNISGFKRSWTTGHTDWIPPEFGANYLVKVYVGPTGWNGTDAVATTVGGTDGTNTGAQVFQVEPGNADAEWYFDYQAGILYWVNENESGTLGASTSLTTDIAGTDKVYIQGYKYIGDFGVGGGIELSDFSVASNSASGGGTLAYDNAGEFTYTPPDLTGFLTSSDISSFIALTDISVGADASASGGGGLSYANSTGVFTYTPPDLSGYLTSSDISSFIALTDISVGADASASGSGGLSYANSTGVFTYTPPDLSGYLTSSDISSFIALTDISVGADASASGSGGLSYANSTGVFTYTPPDLSGYLTSSDISSFIALTDISVGADASASGSGGLSYANSTGVFTYTPPDLSGYLTSSDISSFIALTDISVGADASASGSGGLSYANSTGVFTYTPPDLSGFLESETFTSLTVTAASSTTSYNLALLATTDTATATGVYIESADLTFTHSTSAGRGKLSTGDLLVKGDLTVLGTGSVINLQQENIYVKDAVITLGNADAGGNTDYTDAGELAVDIGIEAFKKGYVTDDATKYPKVVFDHSASVWAVNNWSHADSKENKIAEKYVNTYTWTSDDVTAGYTEVTHDLNTQRIVVQVTNSSDEIVYVKFIANAANTARIYIAGAAAAEVYDIVIIG